MAKERRQYFWLNFSIHDHFDFKEIDCGRIRIDDPNKGKYHLKVKKKVRDLLG